MLAFRFWLVTLGGMPIYHLKCEPCNRVVEKITKVDERVYCECGTEMKRVPVRTGFLLKGNWFKEGY